MKYRLHYTNKRFYINELMLTDQEATKLNEKLNDIAVNRPKSFFAKESDEMIQTFYEILSKPEERVQI